MKTMITWINKAQMKRTVRVIKKGIKYLCPPHHSVWRMMLSKQSQSKFDSLFYEEQVLPLFFPEHIGGDSTMANFLCKRSY